MEYDFNLRESLCAPNLVYTAVLSLVPKLADYHPERFFHEHGSISLKYMTDALNERNMWELTIAERNEVFNALSETIVALCNHKHMDLLEMWEKAIYDVVSTTILTKAQGADAPFQGAFKVGHTWLFCFLCNDGSLIARLRLVLDFPRTSP